MPTFRWLLDSRHEVPALVTRPKAGRRDKRSKISDPMREVAEEAGLPILDPPSINSPEAIQAVRELQPDLLIVCDYGQILSKEALSVARLGGINLHASLLPKYRGAAPINWAIYHGETQTGVTVIHMTPRLDAGPCLVQTVVNIAADETTPELEDRLAVIGVEAVEASVEQLDRWDGISSIGDVQDQALATKAPRLKKSDGEIDWTRTAEQLYCQIRALKPWPGTFTHFERPGKPPARLLIDWAEPYEGAIEAVQEAAPGTVVGDPSESLLVAAQNGVMRIARVQPEGKKLVDAADFVRGYRIESGFRFG